MVVCSLANRRGHVHISSFNLDLKCDNMQLKDRVFFFLSDAIYNMTEPSFVFQTSCTSLNHATSVQSASTLSKEVVHAHVSVSGNQPCQPFVHGRHKSTNPPGKLV